MPPIRLMLRDAAAANHQALASLLYFDSYVHRHLDYRQPLDWVGQQPFPILEERGNPLAALACPPDPPHVAWVHLFATSNRLTLEQGWEPLWEYACARLQTKTEVLWAAAIPQRAWFENLLTRSHFEETHRIATLIWEGYDLPDGRRLSDLIIRPITYDDLDEVERIDNASFVPVWQNSKTCLENALKQAAVATVAKWQDKTVGYQISTPTQMGGHLARLAVIPELQGRGIGAALVRDLLVQFTQRGARAVTVNTQKNNLASLALYRKMNFQVINEEYPIYQYKLHQIMEKTQ